MASLASLCRASFMGQLAKTELSRVAALTFELDKNMKMKNNGEKVSYHYKTMDSMVGKLKLLATDKGLAAVLWENDKPRRVPLSSLSENQKHPILEETEKQLNEYFAGKRKNFSVKLDTKGTEFQS